MFKFLILDHTDNQVVELKASNIADLFEEYFGTNDWHTKHTKQIYFRATPLFDLVYYEIEHEGTTDRLTIAQYEMPLDFDKHRKVIETLTPIELVKPDITRFKMDFANHHNLPYEAITITVNWEV